MTYLSPRRQLLTSTDLPGAVNLYTTRVTGMIASSSTFRPHHGRVIRDLFRLLDAVYGIVRKH